MSRKTGRRLVHVLCVINCVGKFSHSYKPYFSFGINFDTSRIDFYVIFSTLCSESWCFIPFWGFFASGQSIISLWDKTRHSGPSWVHELSIRTETCVSESLIINWTQPRVPIHVIYGFRLTSVIRLPSTYIWTQPRAQINDIRPSHWDGTLAFVRLRLFNCLLYTFEHGHVLK